MTAIQSVFQDPVFDAIERGELTWGDFLPPISSVTPPALEAAIAAALQALEDHKQRDFSALAGRKNRTGTAFASAAARAARISLRQPAVQPEYQELGPEPSVPGWQPQEWDDHSVQSFEEEDRGCEGCGHMRCRCCDGCYPGCAFCRPDFNPADPWDDGAPEEHAGWLPGTEDDWEPSDDEYEGAFLAALCR
jgi:hypothetical protein